MWYNLGIVLLKPGSSLEKEKDMEHEKATVYAYVGNNSGVATDFEGKERRNGWIKLNLELEVDERIEKLSWRAPDNGKGVNSWGSNNIVLTGQDLDRLVGKVLTLADAMIGDKEQRDAWKNILRSTIHEWHDEKFSRYNLQIEE